MPARLSAFFVWALVAASAMFWGLRLVVTGPKAPPHALAALDTAPARVDLTRLLGAPPVIATASTLSPALSSRFVLTGVMAPKRAGDPGVALIAVDGKLPRAYRVGAAVDGELVLQSVSLRSASIGPSGGPAAAVLEVPPLPPAATGVLPPPMAMTPPIAAPVPATPVVATPVAPVAPAATGTPAPNAAGGVPPRSPRGVGGALQNLQQQQALQQQQQLLQQQQMQQQFQYQPPPQPQPVPGQPQPQPLSNSDIRQ